MNKKPNAYRAIFKDDENAYRTDPSVLPNLTGAYFNSYQGYKNNCTYLDDVQYLHFFKTEIEAITYAASLREELGKDVSVGKFYFDEEVLKNCLFKGMYLTKSDIMKFTERDEYIIPMELYDASKNLIGFVSQKTIEEQTKPQPSDPDGYINDWFF
jgi:hypothetical protein